MIEKIATWTAENVHIKKVYDDDKKVESKRLEAFQKF